MATTFPTTPPSALRQAIIAKLGIDPTKLVAFGGNPAFDANVTNLYRDTTAKLGALDLGQSRVGSDYENNLANLNVSNDRARRNLIGTLANRGIESSGSAINQQAMQAQNYQNAMNQLNQGRTRSLEDIGRSRNDITNSLLSGRGTYEAQYTQNLQDWLTQQAQAQASLDAQAKSTAATNAQATAITNAAKVKPVQAAIVRKVTTPAVPVYHNASTLQPRVGGGVTVTKNRFS